MLGSQPASVSDEFSRTTSKLLQQGAVGQYIAFRVGDGAFAFPIGQVREIVVLEHLTPLPQVADCVRGLANLRGRVIPVFDLRKLIDVPGNHRGRSGGADAPVRTIVVIVGDKTIGCDVDEVSRVLRIPDESLQPPPETFIGSGRLPIRHLVRIHEQMIAILDSAGWFGDPMLARLVQPD